MLGSPARHVSSAALVAIAAASLTAAPAQAARHAPTIDDVLAMQRVESPAVSPDGKLLAYGVRDTDVEANRGRFDIWLTTADGSSTRPLTRHPENDTSPAWSPDGKTVLFLSTRSGSSQVWRIAVAGGEAEQVTHLPVDVNGFRPFPDGKRLVLAIDVWPTARTLEASVARDTQVAAGKVKARIYDQLLFRHWDGWEDGKYSHLFVWSPAAGGKAESTRDLTPGQLTDSPTHPFGGMEEVSVAPSGQSIAFVARVGGRAISWSTNSDVFLVSAAGGRLVNLTAANPGYDVAPAFSPDGRSLAVLSMPRAGYEADRARIAILDVASRKRRVVTEAWDRSPGSITWSADGRTIYTSADNVGNQSLFAVDVATGKPTVLVDKGTNADPRLAGQRIVFARDTLRQPAELFSVDPGGRELRQLTHFNDARVKDVVWGDTEQFSFRGAHGDTVYAYLVKPSGFDGKSGRKVPVALLIHGGPQGSFGDHFHYRWNAQLFAGHGYAAVMIDFHGSTGYGQAFTDAINGDWGGAPYEDIMTGLDAALARYRWLDGNNVVAAGGSYGGYMINWINGKTDRFRALVCHDGNIDERMAYFDTEELWFPEWEHGGLPWEKAEGYTKHNPIDLVKNWKTPTLVIHGGNDFRVVDTQGMATFTALQRKGVPSRFIHFPDENHWVLKPQNSQLWYREVLGWLDRYTGRKPGAAGSRPPTALK